MCGGLTAVPLRQDWLGMEEPRGLSLPGRVGGARMAAQAAVVNSSAVGQARCSS